MGITAREGRCTLKHTLRATSCRAAADHEKGRHTGPPACLPAAPPSTHLRQRNLHRLLLLLLLIVLVLPLLLVLLLLLLCTRTVCGRGG